ncbi:GDP-mannose 4,6-dehydratase [Pontibacter sp. JAM-7]|uniref:GDP-mannose 4,6-dehydratase n=1 Tax=Pontibacter sp. JAM-7 TaxID=3366581 RepID=UPI003AF63585
MKDKKRALIIGGTGQDGAHIAYHLLEMGCEVYCGFRRGSATNTWRLQHLGVLQKVTLININVDEPFNLVDIFKSVKPDLIFHLAGESFVADSFVHPVSTLHANTIGTLNVLEALRHTVPSAKLFFASSSEVFGKTESGHLLKEEDRCEPMNPYGISKMTAQSLVKMYRDTYGIFGVVGILFNHEGPLRGRNFVTRKIAYNIARIRLESSGDPLLLGSLDSSRDWGAASDYSLAMIKTLLLESPDDYVFATGKLTSVREFLKYCAESAGFQPVFDGSGCEETCYDGISGRLLAKVSESYFRPHDTSARAGCSKKLSEATDWAGSRSVQKIAEEMVLVDLKRRKQGLINV